MAGIAVPLPVRAAAGPLDDIALSRALDRLSAQSGVAIVYSTDTVHAGMRVDAADADAEVERVLRHWLPRWNLGFERIHDVIVIRRATRDPASGVIAGRVRNVATGAPLPGIALRLAGEDITAISRHDGTFLLQPAARGEHEIVIDSRGWKIAQPAMAAIDASGIAFVAVDVTETSFALDAIVVAPSFYELDETDTGTPVQLGSRDIRAAPKLGGEVLRSVGYLPGVMQNGPSARAHLRGGVADETLYLFDGIRLHDPFHLRDFLAPFSFLDPQRIASAAVHVGSFPVVYGNRLSGVIAFDPIDVHGQFGGEAEFSVFSTSVLLSDSFGDSATGWIASARRGHLDVLAASLEDEAGSPSYFDAYFRIEHETQGGVRLSASALGAHDRLIINTPDLFQETRADYDDQYYWLRAEWSRDDLDVTATLSGTKLHSLRTGLVDDPDEFSGNVYDWRDIDIYNLSTDMTWRMTSALRLRAGAGIEQRTGGFDYRAQRRVNGPLGGYGGNAGPDRAFERSITGDAQYAYAELRSKLSERLHIDAGLRIDRQGYPRGWHTDFGPRVGLSWRASARSTLRFSAGRYWQGMGVEELQVEDGVTEFLDPQRADTMVAGWDVELARDLLFRAEAFLKEIHDPWSRFENVLDARSLVPELEPDRVRIAPQSARVRGVEASIARERADRDGAYWATVALMRATDRIDGERVPRGWNQRWRIEAGASWLWAGWTFDTIVRAASGLPYTPLTVASDGGISLGAPGSESLQPTHALDLRASREWQRGDDVYAFYVEVINAYTGPNECCVDYSLDDDGALLQDTESWYGAVPNIGFRWRF